jgi:hypothetical protein
VREPGGFFSRSLMRLQKNAWQDIYHCIFKKNLARNESNHFKGQGKILFG